MVVKLNGAIKGLQKVRGGGFSQMNSWPILDPGKEKRKNGDAIYMLIEIRY